MKSVQELLFFDSEQQITVEKVCIQRSDVEESGSADRNSTSSP